MLVSAVQQSESAIYICVCVCVCVCARACVVAKKQVFPVWAEVKKVSKSLFWHVFSKYNFSVLGKLKSVSQPPLILVMN